VGLEQRGEDGGRGREAGDEKGGKGGARGAVAAGVREGGDEGSEERGGGLEGEGAEEAEDLVGVAGAGVGGHEGVVSSGGGSCRHCAGGRRGRRFEGVGEGGGGG